MGLVCYLVLEESVVGKSGVGKRVCPLALMSLMGGKARLSHLVFVNATEVR